MYVNELCVGRVRSANTKMVVYVYIYIYICMYIYLMFGNMNDGEKRGRMEKTGRRLMLI